MDVVVLCLEAILHAADSQPDSRLICCLSLPAKKIVHSHNEMNGRLCCAVGKGNQLTRQGMQNSRGLHRKGLTKREKERNEETM